VAFALSLGERVPERVKLGERDKLGEPENELDTEELEQGVAERLGDRVADWLRDWEVEPEKVLDTVGLTLTVVEGDVFELARGEGEKVRVTVTL
jgi:hypothetical protein